MVHHGGEHDFVWDKFEFYALKKKLVSNSTDSFVIRSEC